MAKLTDRAVAKALHDTHGNISAAARALGVARHTISDRIQKDPALAQYVIDARESRVDRAEDALGSAVDAKEGWAVCFTLKTLGKSRGYIERSEVENTHRGGLTLGLADALKVMDMVKAKLAEYEGDDEPGDPGGS